MTRLPDPTHYTLTLDEATGCPHAVRAENYPAEEIAGPLPENWHPAFFDWQPRHDPNGAWMEMEVERRDALWNAVKADREAGMAANVTVTVSGRTLAFQADPVSLEKLHRRWAAAQVNPETFETTWTSAGNAQVTLDHQAIGKVVAAIEERNDALHAWSQAARERIYDPEQPLLRSLGEVKAALDHAAGENDL